MSDEIKVTYRRFDGATSAAYVSETPPHRGIDKHSDEPLEVVWVDSREEWVQIPYEPAVHWDTYRALRDMHPWVDDEGSPVYG